MNGESAIFAGASKSALEKYVSLKPMNSSPHEAAVLIEVKGKPQLSGRFTVIPSIGSEAASLKIVGDERFAADYPSVYTTAESTFQLVNSALIIKSKDIWGNDVEIEVSSNLF